MYNCEAWLKIWSRIEDLAKKGVVTTIRWGNAGFMVTGMVGGESKSSNKRHVSLITAMEEHLTAWEKFLEADKLCAKRKAELFNDHSS